RSDIGTLPPFLESPNSVSCPLLSSRKAAVFPVAPPVGEVEVEDNGSVVVKRLSMRETRLITALITAFAFLSPLRPHADLPEMKRDRITLWAREEVTITSSLDLVWRTSFSFRLSACG